MSYSTLGACIGCFDIFLAILFKLHDEEALLSEHFPVDYPLYKEHTRMILPFAW